MGRIILENPQTLGAGHDIEVIGIVTVRHYHRVVTARHHHHIIFRSQRGTDTLDNLLQLCARCHEAVHQHTLTITGDATTAVFTW